MRHSSSSSHVDEAHLRAKLRTQLKGGVQYPTPCFRISIVHILLDIISTFLVKLVDILSTSVVEGLISNTSRILFIICGVLWVLIGLSTPLLMDRGLTKAMLFVSPSTDSDLFGKAPDLVLASNSDLAVFRGIAIRVIAGLLVAAGILTTGVAWFALEPTVAWALGVLTVVGAVVVPYWYVALRPYREAGIALGVLDLPPFMWVPGILMPIAAVFGWIGYAFR